MFDELDDPGYAGPRTGSREHVAARAARIRRNRRAGWSAGAASAAAVAVLAFSLGADPRATRPVEPVTTGSATPAESPTPTPSPTTASPTASVTRAPQAVASPRPTAAGPSPSVTPAPTPGPEDLVAGWFATDHADSCAQAAELAEEPPDDPSISFALTAPDVVDADDPGTVTLTVTNTSQDHEYAVSFSGAEAGPVVPVVGDEAVGYTGVPYSGQTGRENPNNLSTGLLGSGESVSFELPLLLDTCAPSRTEEAPGEPSPLPAGTYRMALTVWVQSDMLFPGGPTSASPGPRSRWLFGSEPVSVTVA